MPLSDHEQRLLEQIERALYAEDPKFASAVRSTDLRQYYRRRALRAGILAAVGVAALVAGILLPSTPLIAGGAFVATVGALLALASWRRLATGRARPKSPGGRPANRSATNRSRPRSGPTRSGPDRSRRRSIAARLDERWQRRFDERNF